MQQYFEYFGKKSKCLQFGKLILSLVKAFSKAEKDRKTQANIAKMAGEWRGA